MLSSMTAAASAVTKWYFGISRKLLVLASNFKIYRNVGLYSLWIATGNNDIVKFRSCRDLSIMVQSISKWFTVLERLIQVLHFLFGNPLDTFSSWPQNGAQVDLLSSTHNINGYFRITVVFRSHMQVNALARINVFEASDSKRYVRMSLLDECRRVSHCPTNWWHFLSWIYSSNAVERRGAMPSRSNDGWQPFPVGRHPTPRHRFCLPRYFPSCHEYG